MLFLQLSPPSPGRPSRPPSRAPSNPAMSPSAPLHPPVVHPRCSQTWWGPRWLRAGPVRSLPRNRGGNRRRPREVGTAGRVAAGKDGGGGGGLCRSWGALLASISRRWLRVARARPALVHDPDRLLFQGFRFPVRTPVRRDEAVFLHTSCVHPSLFLFLSLSSAKLIFATFFSEFPSFSFSVVFLLPAVALV